MEDEKDMRVAIVTDENEIISPHFGRAQYYLVYEIQDGKIMSKERRPKSSHNHREVVKLHSQSEGKDSSVYRGQNHFDASEESIHDHMLANVRDCKAIIARGMGAGMYDSIRQLGIKPFITSIANPDDAVHAYIGGSLDDHTERLH